MKDRVGEQWGNYRLIQFLGRGGFAEVYLGQHIRLTGQRAALKILATHLSEEDIEKFHNEAETIVSLIHPHIVRVLDFALNEGVPFLVMDYAPGGSLRRRHPRGQQVELNRAVAYVQQVAEGLQYAHDRKIIHRDIKPDNMLIGPRDEVLLSDFGIATIAHGTSSQSAQLAIGTIPYMAPEQIQEHPRPASDQYALAVTVYEWLTGRLPFSGTFTEVAAKHMLTAPPPLRGSLPNLPSEVEQIIMTALAKDPRARFASVQAFARALAAASYEDGYKTVLMPPVPQPQDRTIVSGPYTDPTAAAYPPGVPASDASTFINTPDRGWAGQQPVPAPVVPPTPRIFDAAQPPAAPFSPPPFRPSPISPTPPPVQPAPLPTPLPVSAPVSSAPAATGRQSKVSRRAVVAGLIGAGVVVVGGGAIAFIASESHSRQPQASSTPTPKSKTPTPPPAPTITLVLPYSGHTAPVRSIAWSPDGKLIASGAEDDTVQIWNPQTGTMVRTYRGHPAHVLSVAWSPDGSLIASGAEDDTVRVWDPNTGATVQVYHKHTDHIHGVGWSPDSQFVASGSDDTTVQVWVARTGNTINTYRQHTRPVESVDWSRDGARIVSACDDHTVQIWSAKTGTQPIIKYTGHKDWVLSARWSPDNTLIASAGRDSTIQVWNAGTGTLLFKDTNHTYIVEKVAWSPDGRFLASVSDDKTVQILDASTRKPVFKRTEPKEVYALAWSHDGKFLAVGGNDRIVEVFSVR